MSRRTPNTADAKKEGDNRKSFKAKSLLRTRDIDVILEQIRIESSGTGKYGNRIKHQAVRDCPLPSRRAGQEVGLLPRPWHWYAYSALENRNNSPIIAERLFFYEAVHVIP